MDVLIFATKVRDLKIAVSKAASLKPKCVFFPQNGLFNIDWTKHYFKTAKICRGAITMACQETKTDEVALFYRGNFYVGGDGAQLIADLFREAGIEGRVYRDSIGCIWAKLIFSAVMNPLPVLTNSDYTIIRKNSKAYRLVIKCIDEGKAVARQCRIKLAFDPSGIIKKIKRGEMGSFHYHGSMYHDYVANKKTEIDEITGSLLQEARKARIQTPFLESVYLLMKVMESKKLSDEKKPTRKN